MELPDAVRKRLEDFSRNVLFDQSRTEQFPKDTGASFPHGKPSMLPPLALTLAQLGWSSGLHQLQFLLIHVVS